MHQKCIKSASRMGQKMCGPDNPTSQLLPIMNFKGCSGVGEGRNDKCACVCGMQQADRRKYLNMPKSNMPKHAAGQLKKVLKTESVVSALHSVAECSRPTEESIKHAKIKHAQERSTPTEESASTCKNPTGRSTRKEETCRKDRIFACKWPNLRAETCRST